MAQADTPSPCWSADAGCGVRRECHFILRNLEDVAMPPNTGTSPSPTDRKFHTLDHAGPAEATKRLCDTYYWPTVKKDSAKHVKACHPCQQVKPPRKFYPGIGNFPIPDKRFQDLNCNVMGPVPESEGMKFLLTIVCRSCRCLEAIVMPDGKAETIGDDFLRGWVKCIGIPRRILTDKAQSFVGDLWRDLQRQLWVEVTVG